MLFQYKNKAPENLLYGIMYGFIFFTLFSGCSQNGEKEANNSSNFLIVTTTSILEDVVKNIIADSAKITSIMGPGVDPHIYKASQGDLKKFNQADIVFYNGLHLEGKMGEILKKLGRTKPVIATAETIDVAQLMQSSDFLGFYDPHIWFDVKLFQQVVQHISNSLIEHLPDQEEYISRNTNAYMKKLDSLHAWTKAEIAQIPADQKILITSHDAFGYFGRAYDIEVKGLQGVSTLSEAGLRDISNLVKYIVDRNIKAVFLETSVSPKAIQAVVNGCRERNHQVVIGGKLFSDALDVPGNPASTYVGMIEHNVTTIVKALK